MEQTGQCNEPDSEVQKESEEMETKAETEVEKSEDVIDSKTTGCQDSMETCVNEETKNSEEEAMQLNQDLQPNEDFQPNKEGSQSSQEGSQSSQDTQSNHEDSQPSEDVQSSQEGLQSSQDSQMRQDDSLSSQDSSQSSQDSKSSQDSQMSQEYTSPAEEKEEQLEGSTLSDFGYHFKDGQLRDIKTNGPFEFNVYNSRSANQRRYEKLGEVIEEHIFQLLEQEGGLSRATVPVDATGNEPSTFIFRSEDSFTCDKLLLLVHGSGVVRAGQWARRLVINHSLESGTQLPYIKKAKELGYGVLVLNTNDNCDKQTRRPIRESSSPEEHFVHVWDNFVEKAKAEHIAIIAHSYGGVVTTRAAAAFPQIMKKTFAVAFTDSVHYRTKSRNQRRFNQWMQHNVCNWVSSGKPLDKPLGSDVGDCTTVSAGTSVHEETSWKAFNSVWKFLEKKWSKVVENTQVSSASTRSSATTESDSIATSIKSNKDSKEPSPKKSKPEETEKGLRENTNTETQNGLVVDDGKDSSDELVSAVSDMKGLTDENMETAVATSNGTSV